MSTQRPVTSMSMQVRQLPSSHRGVSPVRHGPPHRGRHWSLPGECRGRVSREQLRWRPCQTLRLPTFGEQNHENCGLGVSGEFSNKISLTQQAPSWWLLIPGDIAECSITLPATFLRKHCDTVTIRNASYRNSFLQSDSTWWQSLDYLPFFNHWWRPN